MFIQKSMANLKFSKILYLEESGNSPGILLRSKDFFKNFLPKFFSYIVVVGNK